MVDATQLADVLSSIDPELITILLSLLVGGVEGARRFRDTGKIPYRQLPWEAKRQLLMWFRKSYFTKDKPDAPSFVVDQTVDEVRESLAQQGFMPEWPLSFPYGGEDETLVLYYFDPDNSVPNRQIQVSLFAQGAKTEVMCHEEPSAYLDTRAHFDAVDRSPEAANKFVEQRLENEVPIVYPSD